MRTLTLSPVRIDDIPNLMSVAASCSLGYWSEKDIERAVEDENSIILGAYDPNGQLNGFISGRIGAGADQPAEIYNVGIMPVLRHKGCGSLLLEAFINKSVEAGASEVWLEVRDSNLDAIQFYVSKGFTVAGRRRCFYNAPVEDAVLMTLKLSASEHGMLDNNSGKS